MMLTARWLSVRLELIGSTVVFFVALFVAVLLRRSAGLAGLALTSALQLTSLMSQLVRQSTELEVRTSSLTPATLLAFFTFPGAQASAIIGYIVHLNAECQCGTDEFASGRLFMQRSRLQIKPAGNCDEARVLRRFGSAPSSGR